MKTKSADKENIKKINCFEQILKEKGKFIDMGTAFYVAARICYYKNIFLFYNILPILFHNSIEYLLKAYLSDNFTIEYMKDEIGHNIRELWKSFKKRENITDKYDKFIKQFDKIQTTRYPSLRGSPLPLVCYASQEAYKNFNVSEIQISLATIDEIVNLICQKIETHVSIIDFLEYKCRNCRELFLNNEYFKKNKRISCLYLKNCASIIADFDKTRILDCNFFGKECPFVKTNLDYPFDGYITTNNKNKVIAFATKNKKFFKAGIGMFVKNLPNGEKMYYIVK